MGDATVVSDPGTDEAPLGIVTGVTTQDRKDPPVSDRTLESAIAKVQKSPPVSDRKVSETVEPAAVTTAPGMRAPAWETPVEPVAAGPRDVTKPTEPGWVRGKGAESEESDEVVCVGPTTPAGRTSKVKEEPRLVPPLARVRLIEFGGLISGVTSEAQPARADTLLSMLQVSCRVFGLEIPTSVDGALGAVVGWLSDMSRMSAELQKYRSALESEREAREELLRRTFIARSVLERPVGTPSSDPPRKTWFTRHL